MLLRSIVSADELLNMVASEKPVLNKMETFTCYATHKDPSLKPCHWHKHHFLIGAKENNLLQPYLQAIESIPDPDPARHKKEMAIYAWHLPLHPLQALGKSIVKLG